MIGNHAHNSTMNISPNKRVPQNMSRNMVAKSDMKRGESIGSFNNQNVNNPIKEEDLYVSSDEDHNVKKLKVGYQLPK